MASRLAQVVAWGSITPLGSAVEPLVNWRTARDVGSSLGASQAQGSLTSPVRSGRSTTGGSPASGWMNPASIGSATTSVVSAARTRVRVWATKSSRELIRIGRGSTTTVAPASHTAWMAVTKGREVGPRRATWAPGPTPRRARATAIALASSWRTAHSTRSPASGPSAERKVMVPPRSAARIRRVGR